MTVLPYTTALSSREIARSLAAVVLLLCMFLVGPFLQLSLFAVTLLDGS